MDSIRVSEAPDPGSIPGEATIFATTMFYRLFILSLLKAFLSHATESVA
jgi:hypothetical protein